MAKKKSQDTFFIFDFDSTMTQVEALEILAEISLKKNPKRDEIIKKIQTITDQGVDGKISFRESLTRRIKVLEAHQDHIEELVKKLKRKISKSFSRNKEFFKEYSSQIYVISCGFKEFIDPIVKSYQIPSERVFANTFQYDKKGNIVGFDKKNVLSKHNGKIECLKSMNIPGKVYVIGDGYSDYVMKEAGLADKFFAYTENVIRKNILDKADHVTPSLDEFLYVNKLPMSISYPKNRIKVLLLENIHPNAAAALREEGYEVETAFKSLSEEELLKKIPDVYILGIRSRTQVTPKVLAKAKKLLAIGAFCIGTNQIDLEECSRRGIAVFNAPYSNTRSVVELAIGEIIMLMRQIFLRSTQVHKGEWQKSAKNSFEVRGKKLGIVGYGNIGQQLSVVAESLGMQVYFYDIVEKLAMGNATKCDTLKELLKKADVVSVHVDGRPENKNLFSENEFKAMKKNSYFLNLSRGSVVDIPVLQKYLTKGKLLGAAVDVYPKEPKTSGEIFESPLQGLDNVILTPHIGGSTEEAQCNIADFVPKRIMEYINRGDSFDSVNLPSIRLPQQIESHRLLHIHKNVRGVIAEVSKIISDYGLNITGQYLKTTEEIGYLIMDVNKGYNKEVITKLKKLPETVKLRVLY